MLEFTDGSVSTTDRSVTLKTLRRLSLRFAVILGMGITALAIIWISHTSHSLEHAFFNACPGIAFTVMLALGSGDVVERLSAWTGNSVLRIGLAPAALWSLYVVYAVGMNVADVRSVAVMAVYLGAPFLFLSPQPNRRRRIWLEPIAILWIWLPLEFGIIRSLLITTGRPDLHYAFAQVLAVDAGIIAFAVWARIPGIGYRFEYTSSIARTALSNFLTFAAIGIPLGIGIGFIHFTFNMSQLASVPGWFAGIF